MTTYNGAAFIRHSIDSVLDQSFGDFELIVVDDCSTDATPEILAAYDDPRLRLIRNQQNLGVAAARNVGFAAVRGGYVAALDHDDVSYPKRLATQVAYLDQNRRVVLVGTDDALHPEERSRDPTPELLRWALLVGNPLSYSSIMFRTAAVRHLGEFMRQQYELADDFDFYHRLAAVGDLALIPERLVIYRRHEKMLSRSRRDEMVAKTAAILGMAYKDLLGHGDEHAATLVAHHLAAGTPVRDGKRLAEVACILERLISAFINKYALEAPRRQQVISHAAALWWRVVLTSARAGAVLSARRSRTAFRWAGEFVPERRRMAASICRGLIPGKRSVKKLVGDRFAFRPPNLHSIGQRTFELEGTQYRTLADRTDGPPYLYVVVDTESEFDWNGPLNQSLISVRSVRAQQRTQEIFDGYGLKPIYLIDYAVASQPEGYEPIREIFARQGCAIGAHLHPWITPPFAHASADYDPKLEEAKLRSLIAAIESSFGVSPLFFKAGRYGLGRSTVEILARLGFAVDFSIFPGADLRLRGGADFRAIEGSPCYATSHNILSLPMTRGKIGMLSVLSHNMSALFESKISQKLRIPGILARAHVVNMVTLTPEGVTAREQIQLIRSLARRGQRRFVMHYHSPSLVPGNTPYVRGESDLQEFLERIECVCRFFFGELYGVPGNPADLLPPQMRKRLWADAGAAAPH